MSTLALGGSDQPAHPGRVPAAVRYADLALLALALPVFLLAGWPLVGYGVAAAAWIVQRLIQLAAERRANAAMAAGNRRGAMGVVAASTLARVWLIALAVLLVGLIAEREDGLAAALLSAALFTLHFGARGVSRLFESEEEVPR